MISESSLERKFVKKVKEHGGIAPKFTSPGFDGMPDRLVLFPKGKVAFVELKAPGEKPRPLQKARHRLLQKLGFQVFILDAESQITPIIDEIINAEQI
jgi:VRR-NUC domain protein